MADNPAQNIDPHDLILVTDNGQFFVVKMQAQNDGHEPVAIQPLDDAFKPIPDALRSLGVELADIPEHVNVGGCSCILLNLQRIEGRGPSDADAQAIGAQVGAAGGGAAQ